MKYFLTLIILFSTICCFSQKHEIVIIDSVEFTKKQIMLAVNNLEFAINNFKAKNIDVPHDIEYQYQVFSKIAKTFNDG